MDDVCRSILIRQTDTPRTDGIPCELGDGTSMILLLGDLVGHRAPVLVRGRDIPMLVAQGDSLGMPFIQLYYI